MASEMNQEHPNGKCPHCQFYIEALLALMRKDLNVTFTEEELKDLRDNGRSLDEVIEELERAERV